MIVSTTISSERFGHAENSESTEAEYIGEVEQEEISGNQETQEDLQPQRTAQRKMKQKKMD